MAYTVYDDFLDDEGQPRLLPVAAICSRRSIASFRQALPKNAGFQTLVDQTFDTIDAANAWEVVHCRFALVGGRIDIHKLPNYGNRARLAERSLGHALTPLGVLADAGYNPDSGAAKAILAALSHYLIARQLNDDAHDWETDLAAGHASYVVCTVLRESGITPGSYNLKRLLTTLRPIFWGQTLTAVCNTITTHTKKARKQAKHSDVLLDDNLITQLCDKIDRVVDHTLAEQTKAKKFLHAYRES